MIFCFFAGGTAPKRGSMELRLELMGKEFGGQSEIDEAGPRDIDFCTELFVRSLHVIDDFLGDGAGILL